MKYCIIIQRTFGVLVRETVDSLPDQAELEYWERYYQFEGADAIVVNVFGIEV